MTASPNRARDLFLAAVRLPPDQWDTFLAEQCAGDAPLRARVRELLAAHGEAGSFLDTPADLDGTADEAPERAGMTIGPYKLLDQIGEGGFGVVYLAEQAEPVRRTVALKVLKPGMDSRQVVARFEAERQALALMDHPHIAKVFDGGQTPTGRPYFVMELVRGVPITGFCDENRLTPRERLELFVQVCNGVQHAHQKGVIHRDLKPTNILVSRHDGTPVVKVIDFGVAKALGQSLTDKTVFTGFAQMVGTPLYMSPEQAGMSGLDADTRSDIYSLGVLLYELLTGTTPFDKARFKQAGYDEIRQIIREEEPARPSARISTLGPAADTVSANRQTDPKRLSRLCRGEVDWIVMRCLEKDRGRRYETANALAADVQRYLRDEVVDARPPSAGYRLGKFLRRYKGRVAAGAALAVSLLVGGGAVVAVQARADRDRAAAAADRMAREAGTAASVSEALREARDRTDEAWAVTDYPDRMQRAADAAVAAVRRAEDFAAAGSPTEATRAEQGAARRDVDELARHARLITAGDRNRQWYADEFNYQENYTRYESDYCQRHAESLRQFGLDPLNGPADDVARAVAASRIRDPVLGILLEWQEHASFPGPTGASGPAVRGRLGQVIRAARRHCGGAHARWQDLLDRKDVRGLVAFAASPDGLGFRSTLVQALGRDLLKANEFAACRDFLRAAVERYPHDIWLHCDLAQVCVRLPPAGRAEALRHMAAASALRPESARFHLSVGHYYHELQSYGPAVAALRKSIALRPDSAPAYIQLGYALSSLGDWDAASAAFQEAVRLRPKEPRAYSGLITALAQINRHDEARQVPLALLQQYPELADPRDQFRVNAVSDLITCSVGRTGYDPPPAERAAYRNLGLQLLTAQLGELRALGAADRAVVHQVIQYWLANRELTSVRDPAGLRLLPADERDAWETFWADVRELAARTAPPKADKK